MEERRSIASLGSVVVALLLFIIVMDVASIGSSIMQLDLLADFSRGDIDEAAAESNDQREMMVGLLYLGGMLVTAICFWVWFYRAYRNIDALGGLRSESPGWTFWGFIIPIISLYKPYRLMRETFTASSPSADDKHNLVGAWWALFLLNGLAGQISIRMARNADTIAELVEVTQVSILSNIIDIPTAAVAIVMVRTLSEWQERRAPDERRLAHVFE